MVPKDVISHFLWDVWSNCQMNHLLTSQSIMKAVVISTMMMLRLVVPKPKVVNSDLNQKIRFRFPDYVTSITTHSTHNETTSYHLVVYSGSHGAVTPCYSTMVYRWRNTAMLICRRFGNIVSDVNVCRDTAMLTCPSWHGNINMSPCR